MKERLTKNDLLLQEAAAHQEKDLFDFARQYDSYLKRLRKGDEFSLMRLRQLFLSVLLAQGRYTDLMTEAAKLKRYFAKQKDALREAMAMNYEARALTHNGHPDQALQLQMRVISTLSRHPDHGFNRNAQHTLSDIFNALGFFEQALTILLQQLQHARSEGNASGELVLLAQLATVCMDLHQYEDADSYLKEAEHLLTTASIPMPFPVTVHRTRAVWLLHFQKAGKALKLVKQKMEPYCADLPAVRAAVYSLIAKCQSLLGKHKEAEVYILKAIQMTTDHRLHIHRYHTLMDAAEYFLASGKHAEAEKMLLAGKKEILQSGSAKFQQHFYQLMEKVAIAKGDSLAAYQHLRRGMELKHLQDQASSKLRLSALQLLSREKFRVKEVEQLKNELSSKREELEVSALYLKQHQSMLKELDSFMKELRQDNNRKRSLFKAVHEKITHLQLHDSEKQHIEQKINHRQQRYIQRIREQHPLLSQTEARVCSLLQQGLSSKEIAALLVIDLHTVEQHRYRIRKKMGIRKGDNLTGYLNAFAA